VRVYDLTFQNGQAPTTFASLSAIDALDENGQPVSLGLPGPYYSRVHFGENLGLTVSGSPNQPFIVFAGTLVVGAQFYPGIGQVDVTDPGSFVVVNGVDGSGVIPGVFYTSAAGSFTFAGPSTLPPGLAIPLQAAVFTGGPTVLGLSNALVVQTL
ncbi:MAG: hypothetical protein KDB53_00680, partial [Planctomycetes bacterium]|nr:hypothetical protein [Planctomycetota bacterium]